MKPPDTDKNNHRLSHSLRLQRECVRVRAKAEKVLEKAREEMPASVKAPLENSPSPDADTAD